MTSIFSDFTEDRGGVITLTGKDSVHVASALRMRPGEMITVCDGRGKDALCVIEESSAARTVCRILDVAPSPEELPVRVFLCQSYPKGDKFEFILQKTTELGVSCVIPVMSDRCISRPDKASFDKKLLRYRDICREAAQQCGRGAIPEVRGMTDFRRAVESVPENAAAVFCYEKEYGVSLRSVISGYTGDLYVFIGPEGGYTEGEADMARSRGITPVTLGKRILRCETAPVFVMSCIGYEFL